MYNTQEFPFNIKHSANLISNTEFTHIIIYIHRKFSAKNDDQVNKSVTLQSPTNSITSSADNSC